MRRFLAVPMLLLAGAPAAADGRQRYIHQPTTISRLGEYRETLELSTVSGSVVTIDTDAGRNIG